jgi:hypothetical protein
MRFSSLGMYMLDMYYTVHWFDVDYHIYVYIWCPDRIHTGKLPHTKHYCLSQLAQ